VTFEKTCFIAPEDIVAVRFTCKECHTAVVMPIGKVDANIGLLFIGKCRHCHAESNFFPAVSETETLIEFNRLLAGLATALKGRNIEYSLQVECPE
jgi:hypothetical protein